MKKILFFAVFMISLQAMAQRGRYDRRYNRSPRYNQRQDATQDFMGTFTTTTELVPDRRYYSGNKQYYFLFQSDGNLAIYRTSDNGNIWGSGTENKSVTRVVFQDDGNLVLSNSSGTGIWNAFTVQKNKGKLSKSQLAYQTSKVAANRLTMQDDGNLVIYNGKNQVVWSSETKQ